MPAGSGLASGFGRGKMGCCVMPLQYLGTAQAKMALAPQTIGVAVYCYSRWAGVAINTWCAGDEIQPCHLSAAGTVAWHHANWVAVRHCSQSWLGLLHTAGGQVWGTAWSPHPLNTETPCRSVPPGWTYEHDMELGRFLYDHSEKKLQCVDCTKEHINSIEVSSQMVRSGAPLQPKISVRHVRITTDVGRSGQLWLSPL